MKGDKMILMIIVGIIVLVVTAIMIWFQGKKQNQKRNTISEEGDFRYKIIKSSHESIGKSNYMISPYSIEMALSMLREGTAHSTREELERIVPERKIKDLSIPNTVNIANAIFIKDKWKKDVVKDFHTRLEEKYQSETIYDSFNSPDKINAWVKKETNGMIPKVVDSVSPDFVLALANAVALEENWLSPFPCENTRKQEFFLMDGKKEEKVMMAYTFEDFISYFSIEDAEGVILPYAKYSLEGKKVNHWEEGEQLEMIAILPKDIDSYIKKLNQEEINKIVENRRRANSLYNISVTIPKFEFEYDFKKFKSTLIGMGMEKVFSKNPDFTNMLENHPYAGIDQAIHKTYVKVDENGTKAAAVTYFDVKDGASAIAEEKKYVSIVFNKPFLFMIKDTTSDEILFFGTVYNPEWKEENSCK